MSTKKINDIVVKKINVPKVDPSLILGYEMIPELYANIFICSRKKTGKTTLVYNILKNCANKDTKVIFFVGTIHKDATYKEIKNKLKNKDIEFKEYDSIVDDNGVDQLEKLVTKLKSEHIDDEENEKENEKRPCFIAPYDEDHICIHEDDNEVKITVKKRKPIKMSPKYIIVVDDMSSDIVKNKNLHHLVRQNRHYLTKIIVSSQYLHDLPPEALDQVDVFILLGGHRKEKLEKIYAHSDAVIEKEKFLELYHNATSEPHNFFFIDKNNGKYRKNFNEEYIIT